VNDGISRDNVLDRAVRLDLDADRVAAGEEEARVILWVEPQALSTSDPWAGEPPLTAPGPGSGSTRFRNPGWVAPVTR
jgi:hypothetical protein